MAVGELHGYAMGLCFYFKPTNYWNWSWIQLPSGWDLV